MFAGPEFFAVDISLVSVSSVDRYIGVLLRREILFKGLLVEVSSGWRYHHAAITWAQLVPIASALDVVDILRVSLLAPIVVIHSGCPTFLLGLHVGVHPVQEVCGHILPGGGRIFLA